MQGKPYRYGGTTPAGFDCSGLMHYTFRQAGLSIPRNSYDQYKASSPVYINRLKPGDLLFFRTLGGTFVSHVGMYIGDNRFVHAPGNGRRVSIDNLDTEYWQKRLVGAGSLLN
jgi:cell wall-associated NlpC family hydrolase